MTDTTFYGVDLETFGLDPAVPIVEVGIDIRKTTSLSVPWVSTSWLMWDDTSETCYQSLLAAVDEGTASKGDLIVYQMHEKNGLWDEARRRGLMTSQVESEVRELVLDYGASKSDPVFGSSVDFDRRFMAAHMPRLNRIFSHRVIDVSTIKETMRRFAPEAFSRMEGEAYTSNAEKRHRVLADLQDSYSEFAWYKENFFITEV